MQCLKKALQWLEIHREILTYYLVSMLTYARACLAARVATRAIARARIVFSAKLFCGALLMSFNYFKNARARSRLVTFKLKAGDCLLLCLLLPHTKLNYIINILLVITTVGSYIIGYIIRITNTISIS